MPNENTVKKEDLEKMMIESDKQEHVFWDKELVISFRLKNGFTILGKAACVDPANFDIGVGRRVAVDDALNKLWELEGYLLQDRLSKGE